VRSSILFGKRKPRCFASSTVLFTIFLGYAIYFVFIDLGVVLPSFEMAVFEFLSSPALELSC
jgi:hypothetical protein